MRDFGWALGLGAAALLLCRPGAAALGAASAMTLWAGAVAPSVFPFLALMPLLTGESAGKAYRRILGGAMRRLFRLPGEAAPALAVGMIAGSPAGALAARRAAARAGMDRGQLCRLAAAAAGFSPAFLLGGVGAGMLGSAALGGVLLRAQILSQLALLLLLRRAWRERTGPVPPADDAAEAQPMRAAVLAALAIAGWMALFGALAGALRSLAGGAADALLCALDVPSGARWICALPLGEAARVALLAAACGFGGACVGLQNLSALRGCGLSAGEYFALRALAGALQAGFAALQLALPVRLPAARVPAPLALSALAAALLAIPVLCRMRKTIS